MAYVSIDDMVADAWVSPAVVALNHPVAIANIRNKRAAGFQIVTRERTTNGKYRVPPPSRYVLYRESLPMVPDPVLQDYLKQDLTYWETMTWLNSGRSIQPRNIRQVSHSSNSKKWSGKECKPFLIATQRFLFQLWLFASASRYGPTKNNMVLCRGPRLL